MSAQTNTCAIGEIGEIGKIKYNIKELLQPVLQVRSIKDYQLFQNVRTSISHAYKSKEFKFSSQYVISARSSRIAYHENLK